MLERYRKYKQVAIVTCRDLTRKITEVSAINAQENKNVEKYFVGEIYCLPPRGVTMTAGRAEVTSTPVDTNEFLVL